MQQVSNEPSCIMACRKKNFTDEPLHIILDDAVPTHIGQSIKLIRGKESDIYFETEDEDEDGNPLYVTMFFSLPERHQETVRLYLQKYFYLTDQEVEVFRRSYH